jgi:hypothetical protein
MDCGGRGMNEGRVSVELGVMSRDEMAEAVRHTYVSFRLSIEGGRLVVGDGWKMQVRGEFRPLW